MFDKVAGALPALVVALAGVGLAWLWFNAAVWIPFFVGTSVACIGLVGDLGAKQLLPNRPVWACWLMEAWILAPGMLAASAAAVLIGVAVETTADKSWSEERKQLVAASVAAVTVFLTTSLIKGAEDADSSWVGSHAMKRFRGAYARMSDAADREEGRVIYFEPESDGERWVYSDPFRGVSGWGFKSRLARARGIRDVLRGLADHAGGVRA